MTMTLADVTGKASITVPDAGQLLGIGRDAAYAAAARGEIPTLRLGRRIVVPVPRLLSLLGVDQPTQNEAGAATAPDLATVHALTKNLESIHGDAAP